MGERLTIDLPYICYAECRHAIATSRASPSSVITTIASPREALSRRWITLALIQPRSCSRTAARKNNLRILGLHSGQHASESAP